MLVANWANATTPPEDEEFLIIWSGGMSIPIPMPPHIDYFNATRETVAHGEAVTFSWDTYKANSLSLNGAAVGLSGSQAITITASGSYTLTMNSEMGTTSHTINIVKDSDGDGLRDENDADDDNDGVLDVKELAWGLNPYDPSDSPIDSDNDGISNGEEVSLGFDPYDKELYPGLFVKHFGGNKSLIHSGEGMVLSWEVYGAVEVDILRDNQPLFNSLSSRGAMTVRPQASATYTLVVKGVNGSRVISKDWTLTLDNKLPSTQWLDSQVIPNPIVSSLLVLDNGSGVVADYQNHIYKLNDEGTIEWSAQNVGLVMSRPLHINDVLYVTSENTSVEGEGRLTALDLNTGAKLWHLQLSAAGIAGAVANSAHNEILVVDYDGNLYGINAATGELSYKQGISGGEKVRVTPVLKSDSQTLYIRTLEHTVIAESLIQVKENLKLNDDEEPLSRPGEGTSSTKWSRKL